MNYIAKAQIDLPSQAVLKRDEIVSSEYLKAQGVDTELLKVLVDSGCLVSEPSSVESADDEFYSEPA